MLSSVKPSGRSNKMMSKVKSACSCLATKVKHRKQQNARKSVRDLLSMYDPQKLTEIDAMMKEWKGKETLLLQHLNQQYHLTDVGLSYFKAKYSRLTQLPPIYRGTMCRKCIRRKNGECRLYHRLYKKKVTPYTVERLKSSINVLRKLNHSHIIRLYDTFESRTRLVLITDLFDYTQCQLSVVLIKYHRYRQLNEWMIANLFDQMLQIVSNLHSKHYIHCDLNPDSFVVTNWNRIRCPPPPHLMGDQLREDEKGQWLDEPHLKLIRVDQCTFISDIDRKQTQIRVSNQRFAPPELTTNNKGSRSNTAISSCSDMWSLGVILYLMLTGMVPKVYNDDVTGCRVVQLDGHKCAWNHLSFHVRDLITKLVQEDPEKRLTLDDSWEHPWMRRYKNGYLQHKLLWDGHAVHLKLYECTLRMHSSIKTLLFLKDSLGMMDDFVPSNDARTVLQYWIRCMEEVSELSMIVPRNIKNLVVDFV